ncbi:hypothetical protein N7475_004751 [Penicillium sp. IBT 31633x]|nr:hypothetical protein N7475_004751 [Penicillium sp. IBT 31633x]
MHLYKVIVLVIAHLALSRKQQRAQQEDAAPLLPAYSLIHAQPQPLPHPRQPLSQLACQHPPAWEYTRRVCLETQPNSAARDTVLPISVVRRMTIGRSVARIMGLALSMNIAVMVILALREFVAGHDMATGVGGILHDL